MLIVRGLGFRQLPYPLGFLHSLLTRLLMDVIPKTLGT